MRAALLGAAVLGLALAASGCATPMGGAATVRDIRPGERPAPDSTEAGLWMQFDRLESKVTTWAGRVHDPELEAYVGRVACELAGDYCPDLRVYVIDGPGGAAMGANGMMLVWTGLLLRFENEAQLATVLAHEIGHYVKRHSLKRWLDLSAKANFITLVDLVMSVTGISVHDLAVSMTEISLAAYSRDSEREADAVGLERMAERGYSPHEAPKLWEYVVAEDEAADVRRPLLLASHPAPAERLESLRAQAAGLPPGDEPKVGEEALLRATGPHRAAWLRADLALRDLARSEVLLDRLTERGGDSAELRFFQGELYRLRGKAGDREGARVAYAKALEAEPDYAAAHRALGLLLLKTDRGDEGRRHLRAYLELSPDADDRAMIEHYAESGR